MRAVFALLAFAASALAISISKPDNSTTWTTDGQHIVTWSAVSSDPSTVAIVLSNQAHFPPIQQLLNAQVDTSLNSINVNPPSGGWPTGTGFQINLVRNNQQLDAILAQSGQFTIKLGSGSSTASSATSGSTTLTVSSTPSATTGAGSTNTDLNPPATTSNTSTSPNNNGAISMGVQAGFFGVVALVGAMLV